MYRTLPQARKEAKAFPFLGSYVATVEVPFTSENVVERMLQSAGHHTVRAAPSLLLACVVAVEPVVP
jgi:hypothetical protein